RNRYTLLEEPEVKSYVELRSGFPFQTCIGHTAPDFVVTIPVIDTRTITDLEITTGVVFSVAKTIQCLIRAQSLVSGDTIAHAKFSFSNRFYWLQEAFFVQFPCESG